MNATLHRSCIRFAPNELSILGKQVESVSWQGCCPYSDRKLFQSLTQLPSGSTLALRDLSPLFFDPEEPLRLCCLSIRSANTELYADCSALRACIRMNDGGKFIRCGLSFSDLNPGQAHCADNQFSLILKSSLALFCSLSADHLRNRLQIILKGNPNVSLMQQEDFYIPGSHCPI